MFAGRMVVSFLSSAPKKPGGNFFGPFQDKAPSKPFGRWICFAHADVRGEADAMPISRFKCGKSSGRPYEPHRYLGTP